MKKRPIPPIPQSVDNDLRAFLGPLKEDVEVVCGFRAGKIEKLSVSASLADVIAKVNEIISKLQ